MALDTVVVSCIIIMVFAAFWPWKDHSKFSKGRFTQVQDSGFRVCERPFLAQKTKKMITKGTAILGLFLMIGKQKLGMQLQTAILAE